jgi:ABC-2 type transport system permease protein
MRYLRLLSMQFRASLLLSMQYRVEFLLDGFVEIFWMATAIVPLFVVYGLRPNLAGWTFGEALMVMGWFTFLQGVLEGAINPSLVTVVDHIRKGTLDLLLIKPADAQFLVSTARFQPWRSVNIATALGVFAWGIHDTGRAPSPRWIGIAAVAGLCAVAVLYSLWMVTVSAAFYLVRIDNLTQLFNAVFDAARWPIDVFPRLVQRILTFVVPLALMTTYPAQALLGRLSLPTLLASVGAAVLALAIARFVWRASIARYTSAGG